MKTTLSFGELLSSLRGDPDDGRVSRARLAEASGLHEKAIVKLEFGRAAPTLRSVHALAKGLAATRGKKTERQYFLLLANADLPPE